MAKPNFPLFYDDDGGDELESKSLRKCRSCGLEAWAEKDLDLFMESKKSRHGKANLCKECDAKNARKRRREAPWAIQLHARYRNMMTRCHDPNHLGYRNYGGRGIRVCDEWLNDPQAYIEWALASGFRPELQIDRINNESHYSPENCQWVTLKNQHRHTRRSVTNFEKGTRICRVCKQELILERDFHRDKGKSGGRQYICKECRKILRKTSLRGHSQTG